MHCRNEPQPTHCQVQAPAHATKIQRGACIAADHLSSSTQMLHTKLPPPKKTGPGKGPPLKAYEQRRTPSWPYRYSPARVRSKKKKACFLFWAVPPVLSAAPSTKTKYWMVRKKATPNMYPPWDMRPIKKKKKKRDELHRHKEKKLASPAREG